MDENLSFISTNFYEKCNLKVVDYEVEKESREYFGSKFVLNKKKIIYRQANITPKKTGQFVTFWKRNCKNITTPMEESDDFDYYVITVIREEKKGQFIIPKNVLIEKAIVSSNNKEGKRGFRVYPIWDKPLSKQAIKTQHWQLAYFINDFKDLQ